ncbi:sodium:proton antiporter [Fischerella thermalis CCMEE 5198]|uniref:cation:proton antiporter domain-containing protein n=1 Tax=Fischerella thermalis TaxID=372787 RepID=UPI000C808504|nr:cation:proton antiporter [Fischerella thermalis]PLZ98547.1 sodium:proton antiporter [Fischerella thermalis CCMEE 5196]PMB18730.1 sodium:proton antiporter [Fischerella thermalis CCMEE 5198]
MELMLHVLAVEPTAQVLAKEPIIPFAILLVVILVVPIIFERLRLPGLVGLVLSGILLGRHGWNVFPTETPTMSLLSDIGLVYLMFVAGLEIDLEEFRRKKIPAFGFGSLTFSLPLVVGVFLSRSFGYEWNAAIFIGSIVASHTLLAYPLINRLGVTSNAAVRTTIGATVITNLGALLVLALCLVANSDNLSFWQVLPFFNSLIVYTIVVLIGCNWIGKEFFRRSGDDEGNQFLFVLLSVFLVSLVAQLLEIEKIVAAFLAGLAVNEAVGEGPVKEKVVFVGSILFIPIFFVHLGLRIDLPTFFSSLITLQFTILLVVSLFASKFIAAFAAKLLYHYNLQETLTMWSLSLPQVGVTLAAALVGYENGLLSPILLNSVVVLMLVSSIVGSFMTSRFAVGLTASVIKELPFTNQTHIDAGKTASSPSTIVVPVYNPQTQQYLIEMAALLARQAKNARIIPLAIATAVAHMDAPQLETSIERGERLLLKATALSRVLGVEAQPLLRIDDAFAQGISRAAREQKADLILMGWGKRTGLRARLFGNVIDSVLWASHCPVAVTRLLESPRKIQRILVPVENFMAPALQPIQFAQILAEANQAQVTVLSVCERRTSSSKIASRRSQLSQIVSNVSSANPPEIQIIAHENVAQAILQAARLYDLVVLPFVRNRTSPGGLAISDVTTYLARQLTCSIVMLGEPQRTEKSVTVPVGVPSPIPVT